MREAEIKLALTKYIVETKPSLAGQFLEEVELSGGQVRADLVQVVNMHCYEIKSAGDNLKRIIGQGSRYARVFDWVTLVTAERHLERAKRMLPHWWGIMLIPDTAAGTFFEIRKPMPNQFQDAEVLATLLEREEALKILEEIGAVRGWRSKSLYQLQARIAELLSMPELKLRVRHHLQSRANSTIDMQQTCTTAQ